MQWFIWVGILVGLIGAFWVAGEFRSVARDKGYEGAVYFWLPFLLGPAGWAVVIALPDKKMNDRLASIASLLEKNRQEQRPEGKRQEPYQPQEEKREEKKMEIRRTQSGAVIPLAGQKENTVVCPECGEVQTAGRNVCWRCGIRFADSDE